MTTAPPRIAWEDSHGRLWQGDVRACLAAMEPESVQCVVCSPPYHGLRSCGTEPQIWGGSPDCPHMLEDAPLASQSRGGAAADASAKTTLNGGHGHNPGSKYWEPTPGLPPMTGGSGPASAKQVSNAGSQFGNAWVTERVERPNGHGGPSDKQESNAGSRAVVEYRDRATYSATCTRCGAWRGELGSEPVPDCNGAFTGVKCGACFICHLVEVFAAVKRVLRPDGVCLVNLGDSYAANRSYQVTDNKHVDVGNNGSMHVPPGLKAKDLVGIPWRFALAMQANGWWLRGDYIWSKPNPMPESVTDRCTRSHEYVFHFSKSERYYWDADAIRESAQYGYSPMSVAKQTPWQHDERRSYTVTPGDGTGGRNARSVWEITTHGYKEAHFATFPPEIPRRAIRAGTSEYGACSECGSPWRRTTDKARTFESGSGRAGNLPVGKNGAHLQGGGATLDIRRGPVVQVETTGWAPTCAHLDADVVPCRVLDIFNGSGTSMVVARQLGRYGIGIELSEQYCLMAMKRLRQAVLL